MAKMKARFVNIEFESINGEGVKSHIEGWVDTYTAATILGITRRRVQAMIGKMPGLVGKKMGRDWLVSLESIRAAQERPELKHRRK